MLFVSGNSVTEKRGSIFKRSLGRQLLTTILVMVILPALLIGLLSYKTAEQELLDTAIRELKVVTSLQSDYLRSFLHRIETELQVEADRQSNVKLLQKLVDAKQQSELSATDFVASYQWAEIVDDYAKDIRIFGNSYGYNDVLLIDAKGNILFTVAKDDDLGANLLSNVYKETLFSQTVQKVLETGQMLFSDFELYGASNKKVAGFFINTVLDEYGGIIGLIALETHIEAFEKIFQNSEGDAVEGLEIYLMGADMKMRTSPGDDDVDKKLSKQLESVKLQHWIEKNVLDQQHTHSHTQTQEPLSYIGHDDVAVLGVLHSVNVGRVPMVIAAEIEEEEVFSAIEEIASITLILVVITIALVAFITIPLTRRIVAPILSLADAATRVAKGDLQHKVEIDSDNELGVLAKDFNSLINTLRANSKDDEQRIWLQQGVSQLNDVIRGEHDIQILSRNIIGFVCRYLQAPIGAFYVVEDKYIRLTGGYAFKAGDSFANEFFIGEGLVGQAVLERRSSVLADIPDDYFAIATGLGNTKPKVLNVIPVVWNDVVVAALEIGSNTAFTDLEKQLLEMISMPIAVAINSTRSRQETENLLLTTQQQAEELTAREETLRVTNSELELKARELEEASAELEERNQALDQTRQQLQKKAEDLELSSKYKSEFLANMSHELRTPLNSLLILAKLLADNKDNSLGEKQVEYANTIHDSGTDLLNLINDILDLAKIESGNMDVHLEKVNLGDFCHSMERKIAPLANKKGLEFTVDIAAGLPKSIDSDSHKLGQVVKNLLSNAMKFTEKGRVSLTVDRITDELQGICGIDTSEGIMISVKDTGIGISEDKQAAIFEAFQQADGTTSRKYGGTGLGLSISRELVKLLGGHIGVKSRLGDGSTFYICLPATKIQHAKVQQGEARNDNRPAEKYPFSLGKSTVSAPVKQSAISVAAEAEIPDDRRDTSPEDRSILVIEDDATFAKILYDIAKEHHYKVLIAPDGETGLHFADFYKPSGIILDIELPGMDGKQVLTRLKDNLETRHIPVHVMSGYEGNIDAFQTGAIGFLTKPINMDAMNEAFGKIEGIISREVKELLVIEDNKTQASAIQDLIGEGDDVNIVAVETGKQALEKLQTGHFDCVVLDLGLPDMSGADLLEAIRLDSNISEIPVVIYTSKELTSEEKELLDQYAQRIIIKNANSPERLLDDTALFLHRIESKLPEGQQEMIRMLHDNESVLPGKKVMVVDDDMRNIFALSNILQDQGLHVVVAKNGVESLKVLDSNQDTDIVLMDIMMPEMDGYEAMRHIRAQEIHSNLPMIALTAKAMKGDRAECIAAGASDYLTKPVDTEKLLSMMRVWLHR